jgi:two-component sensor histidine kinase
MDQSEIIAALKDEAETLRRELAAANARYDELAHRVGNEFQVFLSLFQKRQRLSQTLDFCTPCINHMWSVVALHKMLAHHTSDENKPDINMAEYLSGLAVVFKNAFDPLCFEARVEPDLTLDGPRALLLAKIFCEAGLNALKHGISESTSGTVKMSLTRQSDVYEFIVANDGAPFDPSSVKQDGFHAIRQMAEQIGGEMRAETLSKGMQVRVTFLAEQSTPP